MHAPGRSRALAELGAFGIAAAAAGVLAIQLAYRVSPLAPLIAMAAFATAALVWVRPIAGVYIGIALIPLEVVPLPLGAIATLSPAEAVFAVTGLTWGIGRLAEGKLPFVPSPLGRPLLVILLAVIPGLAVAPESLPVIKVLVMWSLFLLLYQMVVAEAGPRDSRGILIAIAATGGIIGIVAAIGVAGVEQEVTASGAAATGRAVGTFAHPNNLATFLAIALPAALALSLRGPIGIRPLMLFSFAASLAGLLLSLSRGGLLATAGALAVMVAWRPFRRVSIAVAIVVAVLAIVAQNPFGNSQALDPVAQRVESVSTAGRSDPRVVLWREIPALIDDNLIFGVGANSFAAVAPRYGLIDPAVQEPFDHGHNIGLVILSELGIFALFALVWLAVALVIVIWRALRRSRGELRAISFAIAAAFLAVAVQGLVDYTFRSNVVAALLLIMMALAVVVSRAASEQAAAAPSRDTLEQA